MRFIHKVYKKITNDIINNLIFIPKIKIIIEIIILLIYNLSEKIRFNTKNVLYDVSAPNGIFIRSQENELIFTGWCFLKKGGILPEKVLVEINQQLYTCKIQKRQDVVSYFSLNYPDLLLNCGFQAAIEVQKGFHLIKIIAVFNEIGNVIIAHKILLKNNENDEMKSKLKSKYPVLNDSHLTQRAQKIYDEFQKAFDKYNTETNFHKE